MTPDSESRGASEPVAGNRLFEGWGRRMLQHRLLVLLAIAAVSAVAVYQIATKLRVDLSIESFAAADDDSQRVMEEFRDEFGRDDLYVVVVEGDVFTEPYVRRLAKLHRELAAIDLEIESLGERRATRDRKRGRRNRLSLAPPPEGSGDPPARRPDSSADDEFADFAVGDDAGTLPGAADATMSAEWGDEAGGTIIDEVVSLINVRRTSGRVDSDDPQRWQVSVGKWLDPLPSADELARLGPEMLADDNLVGRLVSPNGRFSAITIRTRFMSEEDSDRVYHTIQGIVDRYDTEGFRPLVGGLPALAASINEAMVDDFTRLVGIATLVMLVALFVLFRHPYGVLGPIAVVLLSTLWAYGFMAMFGLPITMLSNILPVLIVSVGIADSIHLQSAYRDYRRAGMDNHAAVRRAIATSGLPCLLTTLTTVVGLLSFRFASVSAVGEFGTAGAAGTLFAFVNSITLLPALLTVTGTSMLGAPRQGRADAVGRCVGALAGLSRPTPRAPRRRSLSTLTAMVALFGCATASALLGLRVHHDPVSWLPEESKTRRAIDAIDAHLGGSVGVQLLIRPKGPQGMKDLKLLASIEQIERDIGSFRHPDKGVLVRNTVSLLDVARESWRALHGNDATFYRLPDSDRAVADSLFLFENSGRSQLRRLTSTTFDVSHLSFQIRWLESTEYAKFTEFLESSIAEHTDPARVTIEPTGSLYTVLAVITNLVLDLLKSFGAAFLLIAILLIVLFREVKLGVLAMAPNLFPVLLIMGFMGVTDIPIDLNTLLIGSLMLGLAVDDTIHFFHHFKVHYDAYGDREAAIDHSLGHAGRAMVSTSIILCAGFLVYTAATMHNIARFGLLTSLAVAVALGSDLIFGPALLRTFYKPQRAPAQATASDRPAAEIGGLSTWPARTRGLD